MNTQKPFVITISREVGSGGHTVGSILAEKLSARYCDKYLLETLESKFDLSADTIEKLKGEKKSWLSEIFSRVSPMPGIDALGWDSKRAREYDKVTTDDIFKAEAEILKGFAQMGSCVIAGRSGFFVFRNHPNALHVFIKASMEHRVRRVMARQGISETEAAGLIEKLDQARDNYIQRYVGVSRYDLRNYDLALCADNHSEEELAGIILTYISR